MSNKNALTKRSQHLLAGFPKYKKVHKETILIIDFGSHIHSCKFGNPPKNKKYDLAEAIISRFFNSLLPILRVFNPDHLIFAIDDKYSIREEVYPQYKEKRRDYSQKSDKDIKLNQAVFDAGKPIMEILDSIGFQLIGMHGLEADDVMAKIAIKYRKKYNVVLCTRDKDLLQCIIGNVVVMYDKVAKEIYNHEWFIKKFPGLSPKDWVEVKSIGGCRTDNVKGPKNIAETSAINFLTGKYSLNSSRYATIINSQEIIERNRGLVKLPHEESKDFKIKINTKITINFKKFKKMCTKYKFQLILRNLDEWHQYFNNIANRIRM